MPEQVFLSWERIPSTRMASMDAELEVALTPVLADLIHATSLTPEFRDIDWPIPETAATMLCLADAGGAGVSITSGADRTDQVVSLADQVQDWAVEALWAARRSPVWPECPDHPDSHPLRAIKQNGLAIWVCPVSLSEICQIGSLA